MNGVLRWLEFGFALLVLAIPPGRAAVLSHSGVEVEYSYQTEFRSLKYRHERPGVQASELALFHAEHIFGVFHSPEMASRNGFPAEMTEGFAGTKHPQIVKAQIFTRPEDDRLWVRYEARSRALILKPVVERIFHGKNSASIPLPLPLDLLQIYSADGWDYQSPRFVDCTDPHYPLAEDFYYFHNPFRCPSLGRPPIGQQVEFKLKLISSARPDPIRVPLVKLKGPNQNGGLVTLYFTFGFEGSPSNQKEIEKDLNWIQMNNLEHTLLDAYGFIRAESAEHLRSLLGSNDSHLRLQTPVTLDHISQRRFFRTYVRTDKNLTWVVRSALLSTDNEELPKPLYSFPKFWKEAWENGDFIYYGGHSGMGQSLRLSAMLRNLKTAEIDKIDFQPTKTQIAFFDSCSSFAHFVDMYREHKSKNLYILSYGLVSLFHLAETTIETSLKLLLESNDEPQWSQVLETYEANHLRPHVDFLYYSPEADRIYQNYWKKKIFPRYLLNVTTP